METGDSFCYTRCHELAVALVTIGVPLLEQAGYMYRLNAKGEESVVWHFQMATKDGIYATSDLISCYNKGDAWFEENPYHPLTMAVHAQRNDKDLRQIIEDDMPFVLFDLGDNKQLHARLGSDEYNEAIAAGLKPL